MIFIRAHQFYGQGDGFVDDPTLRAPLAMDRRSGNQRPARE